MTSSSRAPKGAKRRRPTAADVAHRAGVSRATVSYVLNNTPHQVIPETTRERVRAAAADLGYTPSAAARALIKGRSDVALLVLPDWPIGPTMGSLFERLSYALGEHGLTFVTHPRAAGRPLSDVWKAITPAIVVTFEDLGQDEIDKLERAGIDYSVALFGDPRGDGRVMDIPQQQTGRLQAEHLAAAGHRTLGYAWPGDPRVSTLAEQRLNGVRRTCADLGLAEPNVAPVPLTLDGVAQALHTWRTASPTVTAVCAYNDDIALAICAGAQRQGLAVPHDLAVIGVDDLPAAGVASPTLTTVRFDTNALADYIADSIVRRLEGRPAAKQPTVVGQSVICREST